jgi:hypothetical protein
MATHLQFPHVILRIFLLDSHFKVFSLVNIMLNLSLIAMLLMHLHFGYLFWGGSLGEGLIEVPEDAPLRLSGIQAVTILMA